MRPFQKIFWIFIILSALFIGGSILNFNTVTMGANLLLIPVLVLYYRFKAKRWFLLMVFTLLMFYIRDVLFFFGFSAYNGLVIGSFFIGLIIVFGFAVTGFQQAKVHAVEWISLLIMYGFLGFLFYTIAELVPQVIPSYQAILYLYLFLLTLLLAITFTAYLLKSHYASLWLMLASASLLVSELSLFFKMYVIEDISVKIFFPLFHVIAYYALVEHALHRRPSSKVPYL